MKIYVAGHTGMLGSAIMRALEARGYEDIVTYSRWFADLRDPSAVRNIFSSKGIEYVFMAAGRVGGIQANIDNQAAFLADNAQMALNIIDACKVYGARLCYVGSSCMYPRECQQPMRESDLLTGAFEPTNEGYALAKSVGLRYAQYSLPDSVQPIPCNLYGTNDHYDPRNSHVFPALIRRFVEAVDQGLPSVMLWGTGVARREFLHVDDCADALVTLMTLGNWTVGPVNVGSGRDITIYDLAWMIADIAGFQGDILWDTSKPDGMPRKLMDNSKLEALGWQPKIDLREGITRTIAEYRAMLKETAN